MSVIRGRGSPTSSDWGIISRTKCKNIKVNVLFSHLHYLGSEPLYGVPDSEAGPLGHGVVDDELLRTLGSLLITLLGRYEGEVGGDVGKY